MIKHIVMWKLKAFAEGNSEAVNAQIIKSSLEDLKSLIPQIQAMEVGIDINKSIQNYDLVLYSEFYSMDDLNIYINHPECVKAEGFIDRVKDDAVVVDYEV